MVTNSIFEGRLQNLIIEIINEFLMYCTVPCLVLFLSPNLVSDLGGLVPTMGAMWVVVAAGEVVVGALVPILVPVVGLVQIAVAPAASAASAGGGGSSAAAAGVGGSSAAAAAGGGR